MNFPKTLEDAARDFVDNSPKYDAAEFYGATVEAFTEGAHFALRSDLVRELVSALEMISDMRPDTAEYSASYEACAALAKYSDTLKQLEIEDGK